MYYHVGDSQGHQEQVSGLVPLDVGEMLITNRAVYFSGQQKTLRIPLDYVIRYQSYVDAVGVCESHGTPKVFILDYSGMDTGWFFFNLLSALTRNPFGNDRADSNGKEIFAIVAGNNLELKN